MVDEGRWRANRNDLWVLALFFLLVTWTFRGLIAGAKDPFLSSLRNFEPWKSTLTQADATRPESFADDPTTQTYPWAVYAHENLVKGEFPLWNTRMFSGTPFVANRLTGLFDPLTLLPVWLFSPKTGLAVFYFVHYLMAAWFMYLFLKNLGISRPAATFGAIAYIFQGSYIPWMGFIVADKAYFPAVMYYLERTCDRKDKVGVLGFIISFALLAITSYPQMAVFAIYIALAWVLFTRGVGVSAALRRGMALAVMLVLAFLLGAMQHLPTLEFFRLSLRAQPDFGTELAGRTFLERFDSPLSLLAIIFPRIFGDYLSNPASILPEEVLRIYNHAYIGILAAIGFIFGFVVRKNRHAKFFIVLSILGLIFLAWNSFYMVAARILPGFRISTVKPDFLTLTSMIVVASFVLDHLLRNLRENALLARWYNRIYCWILGSVLGMAVVVILARIIPGFFAAEDFIRYMSVFQGVVILWLAGALLYLHSARELSMKWVVVGLIVLQLIDLVPYHQHFMPLVDRGRTAFVTPSIEFLMEKMRTEGPFRIFRNRSIILAPNTPMLYDLDEPGGFDSFVSADYSTFFREIDPQMSRNSRTLDLPRDYQTYRQPFWSFLGIRYLLSPGPMDSLPPPWTFAWKGEVWIYENPDWQKRWFLVPRIIPVRTVEDGYSAAQAIDPAREAVVDGIEHADIPPALLETPLPEGTSLEAPWEARTQPASSAGTITVRDYLADEVLLDIDCQSDSFLVFSDTWFPGWRAWVDGREVKVYRADGIVKGIVAPQGKHSVRFLYDPMSYKIGWSLALLGLILTPLMVKPLRRLME